MTAAVIPVPSSDAVAGGRLEFLDMLRAVASHLLVWHHLAFYGPLADHAYPLAPLLIDWLGDQARMVVQVFLVIGGFGTALRLTRLNTAGWRPFCRELVRRYRRLVVPYLAILPLAVCANALASRWMDHPSISSSPTLPQLLAHALLVQDVLRYEPLSAGIWYLAIDFQLFALALAVSMLTTWWTGSRGADARLRGRELTQVILGTLAMLSLFWFNRNPALDCWGIYHLGSYFLGMLVYWTISGSLSASRSWISLGMVGAALAVDWRPRLLVAACTALMILLVVPYGRLRHWPDSPLIRYFGRISFSLFLIHFPVCLVVSAWLSQWPLSPTQALAGMVAAWGWSVVMAIVLHHAVERRCEQERAWPGGRRDGDGHAYSPGFQRPQKNPVTEV